MQWNRPGHVCLGAGRTVYLALEQLYASPGTMTWRIGTSSRSHCGTVWRNILNSPADESIANVYHRGPVGLQLPKDDFRYTIQVGIELGNPICKVVGIDTESTAIMLHKLKF